MPIRRGVSLIETLVVLAIVGILLAMMFPAVQSARRRALETECKNHLRQINLAVANYVETHKHLPGPAVSGRVGGWTIDVLPFLEQKDLWDRVTPDMPIQAAPDFLLRQPGVFRCPVRRAAEET